MRTRLLATVCLVCGTARTVCAHPGHGHPDTPDGPAHYLTSPLHYGPPLLLAAATVLILAGLFMLRRRNGRGPAVSPVRHRRHMDSAPELREQA